MATTGDAIYNKPLKPRIRIYNFSDSSYSSPIYTYNPFTANNDDPNKPSGLFFETSMSNVGSFSLMMENNNNTIDPHAFHKGNRVFVDCSKDGSTFQPAFKGLVRGTKQDIFASKGKNLTIAGYSYLIRYNERLLNIIKESTKIAPGGENDPYNRNDLNMFTNHLINHLVNSSSNYISSPNDTQLYNVLKGNNIASSPIDTWVPIVNAELSTVNEAINRVLEFSNSVLMVNFANDQLVLYNPDSITSDTQVFMITTRPNKNADDADITMYPTEPYTYDVGYDHADAANRLIISYKDPRTNLGEPLIDIPDCPDVIIDEGSGGGSNEPTGLAPDSDSMSLNVQPRISDDNMTLVYTATFFRPVESPIKNIRLGITCRHKSELTNHPTKLQIRSHNSTTNAPGTLLGTMTAYPANPMSGGAGATFSSSNPYPAGSGAGGPELVIGTPTGTLGPSVTVGGNYWLVFYNDSTNHLTTWTGSTRGIGWITRNGFSDLSQGRYARSKDRGATWTYGGPLGESSGQPTGTQTSQGFFMMGFASTTSPTPPTTIPGCPGYQEPIVNHDQFVVARDTNGMKQIGIVEKPVTTLAPGTHNAASINEYLFSKLYASSKPRFDFSYPSVTMPNKMPKAGDLVVHMDPLVNVGTLLAPVQTGIITDIRYDFGNDDKKVIGLRKISLNTTGIRRGYY